MNVLLTIHVMKDASYVCPILTKVVQYSLGVDRQHTFGLFLETLSVKTVKQQENT